MLTRPVTSDVLARLKDERDAADRAYNEALTAVDQALPAAAEWPAAPAPGDEQRVAALGQSWEILAGHQLPPPRGLRSRLAHFIWRVVAPAFERQQHFNSQVVDRLNRQLGTEREVIETLTRLTAS